jgi:hypothetical protein
MLHNFRNKKTKKTAMTVKGKNGGAGKNCYFEAMVW